MREQDINIAIAEACGWERTDKWKSGWMKRSNEWPNGLPGDVPNYCHDLNAMHEAENAIACEHWWGYVIDLNKKICEDADEPYNNDPENSFCLIHASAIQRAEAFLRTIGKWKETKGSKVRGLGYKVYPLP